mmetsp:Transcript_42455/g.102244  ORF Transcript_42455/g.102244 Transcript_42455/m.102244 type:complete len:209 (-) Transcript_42455:378-1004(-)
MLATLTAASEEPPVDVGNSNPVPPPAECVLSATHAVVTAFPGPTDPDCDCTVEMTFSSPPPPAQIRRRKLPDTLGSFNSCARMPTNAWATATSYGPRLENSRTRSESLRAPRARITLPRLCIRSVFVSSSGLLRPISRHTLRKANTKITKITPMPQQKIIMIIDVNIESAASTWTVNALPAAARNSNITRTQLSEQFKSRVLHGVSAS